MLKQKSKSEDYLNSVFYALSDDNTSVIEIVPSQVTVTLNKNGSIHLNTLKVYRGGDDYDKYYQEEDLYGTRDEAIADLKARLERRVAWLEDVIEDHREELKYCERELRKFKGNSDDR